MSAVRSNRLLACFPSLIHLTILNEGYSEGLEFRRGNTHIEAAEYYRVSHRRRNASLVLNRIGQQTTEWSRSITSIRLSGPIMRENDAGQPGS